MNNDVIFQIDKINLKNGVTIQPKPITIIVGSNNSGKTRLLKEIKSYTTNQNDDLKILESINAKSCDLDKLLNSLGIEVITAGSNDTISYTLRTHFDLLNQGASRSWHDSLMKDVGNDALQSRIFKDTLGKMLTGYISTEDRLMAAKATIRTSGDDGSLLYSMYREGTNLENQISDYVYRAFKKKVKLDFSDIPNLSIRIGDDFSHIPPDPRDARPKLSKMSLLEGEGDGLRSFTTTVALLLVSKTPYLLLDEPEAFLHPPQAYELGRILSELTSSSKNIILSTHSVDLLKGILSKQPDINIIRLSRTRSSSSAHLLDAMEIQELRKNPLLSSHRVLDSLFYQGCVIVEGDSDRLFYEKIARQYEPADDVHYTHSQSKQSIHKFIPPYRRTNVRFACILDFDILRVPGDLKKLLQKTELKEIEKAIALQELIQQEINGKSLNEKYEKFINEAIQSLESASKPSSLLLNETIEAELRKLKSFFEEGFDETDRWIAVKKTGINALTKQSAQAFMALDALCRSVGIFILPFGSLEGSLASEKIPYSNNKKAWLQRAVEFLDKTTLPETSDLLKFVREVHNYLRSA